MPLSVSGTSPKANKESSRDEGGTWVVLDEDKDNQVASRRSLSYQESCSIRRRPDALGSIVMPPQDQEDTRQLVQPATSALEDVRRSQRILE